MKNLFGAFILAALLLPAASASSPAAEAPAPAAPTAAPAMPSGPVTLPKDIVWETNATDPIIGSPKALRGGTLNLSLYSYPLTLRSVGPNASGYFANWVHAFNLPLVAMHPVTDKFIPMLATAWSVQPDQKTIYFKLDPDARWSDGRKITADDYVFALKFMQSPLILDPYQNELAKQFFQSVDKIDDYTIRIVGTRWSWRPLYDYGTLSPVPVHATKLDKDWVTRTNNDIPIVPGPYYISELKRGQSVTFSRIKNWWGDKKRYFVGLNNVDQIKLLLIPQDRELDYVRNGTLDMMQEATARSWVESYNFPAINDGWLHRTRFFVEEPSGIYGLHMNLQSPLFSNKNFRIAIQSLFNFGRLNQNLMYNQYFRMDSFFQGTDFANPNVKAYPFDPVKAREYLARAGFHRPHAGGGSFLGAIGNVLYGLLFTRSDTNDVLVNDKGEKASFTVIYDQQGLARHLTVVQQDLRRAGIDMRLQLLEPETAYERAATRKYEMFLAGMTSTFYPDPRPYLSTAQKITINNNDFWGFGTKEVDDLIKTYEESPDADARKQATYKIDQIVHDEAFYLPFWDAPYIRMVYWDYVQFPETGFPKRTGQYLDWMVYWIDPAKKAQLAADMKTGKAYPVDKDLDKDFYHVKDKFK